MATDLLEETDIETQTINTIRFLSADAVQRAESGHPGTPMGLAPVAYVLWTRHLRHNPQDPDWPGRDRFVLSAGHASMLLYSLLHLTGYDLPMEELKGFRQWGSRTPGHPEAHLTPGVETTTGPLGQGFANGVGMAIAEQLLADEFNEEGFPLFDHHTYAICSDGDLMEGISQEAASLAGHLGLGKLVYFFDDNDITIDGSTDLAFTEDVAARFEAYGWHVAHVEDANDLEAVDRAIEEAKAETERPSLIRVQSHIGYGSPNKQDTAAAHGAPLGEEELRGAKENLGWPPGETFYVPDAVYDHMRAAKTEGQEAQREWEALREAYEEAHPGQAARLKRWMNRELPEGWEEALPAFEPTADTGEELATRKASGLTLEALAPEVGYLIGGSADLTGSNKTDVEGRGDFQKDSRSGRYFRFGVREHAMAGLSNGMALHGGIQPYAGTFLIFSDYLRPSLRLSALMEQPVVYVFTHDSIGLGEDGPTHQPVEHLMALRAIPGATLIRPADANEAARAWAAAVTRTDGPTALALTRQTLPIVDRTELTTAEGLRRGAYILREAAGQPDAVLMGTGSEVQHALQAARALEKDGIQAQVVSMPSWELFEEQSETYRRKVLPPSVEARVSIEAGVTQGWERYVGPEGTAIGVDRFGASAPGERVMEEYGLTAERVAEEARSLVRG
ncbi:transketolase [Salinibacter ruber]|uniref:transketolase n=1 Tax=Salinibacter ruber TaxID=146919 RepID=UPI002167575C|nr:transketolase [Salinibacter ruber]MCS3650216.1 transketolase [Salinibacter ruber]MCS3653469.1 transketolase [Salinibacter ruber]